jgi:hypothetical protein
MAFKISPQDAFARAERMNDKFNRKNKTNKFKEPTLEEQIAKMNALDEKNRQERLRKREEEENKKHFSPMYEAKFNYEQSLKNKDEKNKNN